MPEMYEELGLVVMDSKIEELECSDAFRLPNFGEASYVDGGGKRMSDLKEFLDNVMPGDPDEE